MFTCGKVANWSKSLMEQKSCRLTQEVMMSKHMVNSTRLPSFLPGPKIYNLYKYHIGTHFICNIKWYFMLRLPDIHVICILYTIWSINPYFNPRNLQNLCLSKYLGQFHDILLKAVSKFTFQQKSSSMGEALISRTTRIT